MNGEMDPCPASEAKPEKSPLARAGLYGLFIILFLGGLAATSLAGAAMLRPGDAAASRSVRAPSKKQAKQGQSTGIPKTQGLESKASRPSDSGNLSSFIEARTSIPLFVARLESANLPSLGPVEAAQTATALLAAARRSGIDQEGVIAAALPSSNETAALLSTDRDLEDFLESAEASGARDSAARYAEIAKLVPSMRKLRPHCEAVLAAAYAEITGTIVDTVHGRSQELGPLAARGALYTPSRSSLKSVHPYALDIFFAHFEKDLSGQVGPELLSVSQGIVLAAADDWKGGAGAANYKSGGLSPNSGNGVVIYDPAARRFYSYFHLSRVYVAPGEIVTLGEKIGRGGNTGANARKKNHGGHVHIEIFDAVRGHPLSSSELRELLF